MRASVVRATVLVRPKPTILDPQGEAVGAALVHLGFEVRVDLVRDDGQTLSAQLTREQVEALELQHGQIVYVRPTRQTVFAD